MLLSFLGGNEVRLWEIKFNTSLHGDYKEELVELVPESYLSIWLEMSPAIDEVTIKCLGQISDYYVEGAIPHE